MNLASIILTVIIIIAFILAVLQIWKNRGVCYGCSRHCSGKKEHCNCEKKDKISKGL